jgi:hypothetical protein
MQIEFIKKTKDSWSGNCPAIYRVTSEEGGYVVQGKRLDGASQVQPLGLGPDEARVWVQSDVIDGSGNSPVIRGVESEDGGYVVQGRHLDDETRAQLCDLGLDEDGVWVPSAMVGG